MQWIKKKSQLQEYYPFSRMTGIPDSFAEYIKRNPNKKHISAEEKWKMIGWLSDANVKPSCQKEYSRRNYAQKTYRWDENRQQLLAMAKNGKENDRIVITEDEILRVVEEVHITDHAGWDATWSRVSKKYCGIVRSDVIWLITRCGLCKVDPRKKSKANHEDQPSASTPVQSPLITPSEAELGYHNTDDTIIQIETQPNVFQDISLNDYLNTYIQGYQDMSQDGSLETACQDAFQDVHQGHFQDIFQNGSQVIHQGGFQTEYQGELQDSSGWQAELLNIDPSLLLVNPSPFANYSQGEPSGTNNYTYNNESGQ